MGALIPLVMVAVGLKPEPALRSCAILFRILHWSPQKTDLIVE